MTTRSLTCFSLFRQNENCHSIFAFSLFLCLTAKIIVISMFSNLTLTKGACLTDDMNHALSLLSDKWSDFHHNFLKIAFSFYLFLITCLSYLLIIGMQIKLIGDFNNLLGFSMKLPSRSTKSQSQARLRNVQLKCFKLIYSRECTKSK